MGLWGLPGVCLLSLLTLQVVAAQGSPTGSPRGGKVCGHTPGPEPGRRAQKGAQGWGLSPPTSTSSERRGPPSTLGR